MLSLQYHKLKSALSKVQSKLINFNHLLIPIMYLLLPYFMINAQCNQITIWHFVMIIQMIINCQYMHCIQDIKSLASIFHHS